MANPGGGEVESLVPLALVEFSILAANQRLLKSIRILNEVESKLPFDTKCTFISRAIHRWLYADNLVAFAQHIDRASNAAVGADCASFLNLARGIGIAKSFFVAEGSRGTGLNALSTEGAVGIAKVVIELGNDLGVKPAIFHIDGVIAFLLGADANTAVAGYAIVVVAQDERIFVVRIRRAGLLPGKTARASGVAIDKNGEFLRGVSAQCVHIDVSIFGSDHFEKRFAVLFDFLRPRANNHALGGLGGAGGDGITNALHFDHAEGGRRQRLPVARHSRGWGPHACVAQTLRRSFRRRKIQLVPRRVSS